MKALPSFDPPRPSGVPLLLRIRGLPNIGCMKISAMLDGFSLVRPGLTFIQAPIMLFHIEHGILLTFGAAKI
jgi:hypothetical protein